MVLSVSSVRSSGTSTVSITVANRVWYVKNDFVGTADGRSQTPFTTLAAADTAVPADTIVPAIESAIATEPDAAARVLLTRARDAAIGGYVHTPPTTKM